MKLKSITFAEGEEGANPETVTVEMTILEALWCVKVAGKQKGESPHSGIYDCLISDVVNRYWEDGIKDAQRELQVEIEIPPIVYLKH